MDQNKGKGRALSDQQENSSIPNPSSRDPSLLSRIATSAEGLTRNAFSSSTSAEVSSTLSNSEKAQSSGTTIRNSESSQTSLVSSRQQQAGGDSTTFRDGHNEKHVRQSETEFSDFLDGIDTFKVSETSGMDNIVAPTSSIARNLEEQGSFDNAWLQTRNVQAPSSAHRTVAEQELRDGEDVLALLSDPTTFDYEQFEVPLDNNENHDWGLSPEQLMQLQAMTKELFPPSTPHGDISASNTLNLIPQSDIVTSHQLMGYSDFGAMDQWRDQWEGVLTRYADEVWGCLLPLVKEARQEAEDMKDNEVENIQPKALRRLEAILGHLQKR